MEINLEAVEIKLRNPKTPKNWVGNEEALRIVNAAKAFMDRVVAAELRAEEAEARLKGMIKYMPYVGNYIPRELVGEFMNMMEKTDHLVEK